MRTRTIKQNANIREHVREEKREGQANEQKQTVWISVLHIVV